MHLDFQATGKLKFTFLFNSRREFVWINTIFYFHLLYSFLLYFIFKNPDPGLILKLTKACEINRIRNLGTINLIIPSPQSCCFDTAPSRKKKKKMGKICFCDSGQRKEIIFCLLSYPPLWMRKVLLLGWNSWEKSSLETWRTPPELFTLQWAVSPDLYMWYKYIISVYVAEIVYIFVEIRWKSFS